MRTWILVLFCVVVIAAAVNADGGGKEEFREKGKGEVDDGKEGKGMKRGNAKKNGNGDKNPGRNGNRLEKPKKGQDAKRNGPKGDSKPRKANGKPTGRNSGGRRKNTGRQNGPKKSQRPKPNGVKTHPKQLVRPKKSCPGECVASEACDGRQKKGLCRDDLVCCLPKANRAQKDGTTVKRFCKPLTACSAMKGECRKSKTGCNLDEKRFKNKKNKAYCDKKSCVCCVKQCAAKGKCKKLGGSCMPKKQAKKQCTTSFLTGKKYCQGKKCGCCAPVNPTCNQKKTCTSEGGSCVALGSTCNGEIKTKNNNGKNYCKGSSCGCCLPSEYGNRACTDRRVFHSLVFIS
ncbi:uncharacterized protein [Macrobrachium rosenbergii]|uniref:uncharacterized protein n=1 Tax=Macrobrachium rosenbergii TaxID=79674 RepID=UPI0034D60EB5